MGGNARAPPKAHMMLHLNTTDQRQLGPKITLLDSSPVTRISDVA